jgi:predicted ATP-dependent serine protease
MKIKIEQSGFVRACDVTIPDIFNRRFKTNEPGLDFVFGGEGFLPGMSFTFAAPAGSGKTTMLLQTLELLEKTNKKTAYISGEETIQQLAFTCKRLGVKNVSVANMTVIEDIFDAVKKNGFEMIILDSLPSITSRKKLRGRALEEYLSNYITSHAKELECVIGIILHMTKDNKFKGSTLLPHSVDANFMMFKSKDDPTIREIEAVKNRFGICAFSNFRMTESGFSFVPVEVDEESTKKKTKSETYKEEIMKVVNEKGTITLQIATQVLKCSLKAQQTLRDLTLQGKLTKEGRGQNATWMI